MVLVQRFRGDFLSVRLFATGGTIALLGSVVAGCSADISRLERPQLTVNEAGSQSPRPSEPLGRRNNAGVNDREPQAWPNSGPRDGASAPPQRMAALPPPPAPSSSNSSAVGPSRPFDAPKPAKPAAAAPAERQPMAASGQTVDVQPGDTLYAISKRTGVSIAALMEVNNLKSATLKPGQKLALPAGAKRPMVKSAAVEPAPATAKPAPVVAAAPVNPGDWTGTHVVKSGDSLYAIARSHQVKLADLQQVNGISDATKVRPGTTLKVPGSGAATPAATPAPAPITQAAAPAMPPPAAEPPRVVQTQPVGAGTSASPKILNNNGRGEQVASAGTIANDAVSAPTASASVAGGKFRWPVQGKVIAEFGKRPDGTHNDGINVSVPAGTNVVAADGGTVAYANNELKGYGNLILVRHDNGWVSAYAHVDQMLVKRGDAVKRGQLIAKAGKTGQVDQPQLHFELRQGSKPVDPLPHMDRP